MALTISYPPQLPVSERREDIMAAIAANQVTIIAGETGSGKTTQIPKMCLELGLAENGLIGHTQPRRLAARTVSERRHFPGRRDLRDRPQPVYPVRWPRCIR